MVLARRWNTGHAALRCSGNLFSALMGMLGGQQKSFYSALSDNLVETVRLLIFCIVSHQELSVLGGEGGNIKILHMCHN